MTRFTRRMKGGIRIKKTNVIKYIKDIVDSLNNILDESSKIEDTIGELNKMMGITDRYVPVGDLIALIRGHHKVVTNTSGPITSGPTTPILGGMRRTRKNTRSSK